MKKLVILVYFIFTVQILYSQKQLQLKTYIERTVTGPKLGIGLGIKGHGGYEYGGFYQEAQLLGPTSSDITSTKPYPYEKTFYGLYGTGTLLTRRWYDLKLQARMGITNKENFIITPSVIGRVKLANWISLETGLGFRQFRPTYQGAIVVSF